MSWIQLDDTHWAKEPTPDPQEIVDITELQAQIDDLKIQLDAIDLLEVPEGADDRLREAVERWNIDRTISLQTDLDRLIAKLNEITGGI